MLGSFSVDSRKDIMFNNSMMPKLCSNYIPDGTGSLEMEPPLDLKSGWDRINGFTATTADTFNHFLQWIIKNQNQLKAKNSSDKLRVDILCTRGTLKSVMLAPCTRNQNCEMIILAQSFKGSIYMTYKYDDHEGEKKDNSACFENYGHKFQQYMTGGNPDDVLECDCQFRCVLNLHLNELSLLYPIAIHGVDESLLQGNLTDTSAFVSIKETREKVNSFKQDCYERYTLNKWWIENQLAGIPRLLMGTRNEQAEVQTVQIMHTDAMPSMAKGKWKPSVCINFLERFLSFVMEKVTSEPNQVHRFDRSASDSDYITHFHDTSVTDILPMWYKKRLFTSEEDSV
ncbi:Decapping and exoribonuclease protein [Chionoecetes opilio]|uniref:Decapping nuclease n=1 Tax=Chionoecetes opilio TaxID=41210 RepID=A0A8J5CII4_CHIOP|nr:Decapping and exoribonuclease protein [Chionoecetes opilio]